MDRWIERLWRRRWRALAAAGVLLALGLQASRPLHEVEPALHVQAVRSSDRLVVVWAHPLGAAWDAGVRPGDVVLAVDGREVGLADDAAAVAAADALLVRRGDGRTLAAGGARAREDRLRPYRLAYAASALVAALVGVAVFFVAADLLVAGLALTMLTAGAATLLAAAAPGSPWAHETLDAGPVAASAGIAVLFLAFPVNHLGRWPGRLAAGAAVAAGLALLAALRWAFGADPAVYAALRELVLVGLLVSLLAAAGLVILSALAPRPVPAGPVARLLAVGLAAGLGAVALLGIGPHVLGLGYFAPPELAALSVVLLPPVLGAAILGRQVVRLELLASRAIVALLVWTALALLYAGVARLLHDRLVAAGLSYATVPGASLLVLLLLGTFSFAQARGRRWLAGVLFGDLYDHAAELRALSHELAGLTTAPAISEHATARLAGLLGLAWAALAVGASPLRRVYTAGKPPADLEAQLDAPEPADPRPPGDTNLTARLPLVADGAAVGVLALGPRRWRAGLSRDDRLFLDTLAPLLATALRRVAGAHRLSEILESIDVGFVALDREWRVTYANLRMAQMLGRPRDELLGALLWKLYPQPADSTSYAVALRAMAERTAFSFERRWPPSDHWWEVSGYPIDDGLALYVRDVTERKLAEQRLRESAALYQTLAETVPDSVHVKDAAGRYLAVNRAMAATYGRRPEEVVGKLPSDLYPPELAAKVRADDLAVLLAGETVVTEETHERPSGTWTAHVVKVPLRDAAGRVTGVVTVSRDITPLKEAEARARAEATRAGALLGVAARLGAQLDLAAVLQGVCEETSHALGLPALVGLLDPERDEVAFVAGHDLPDGFAARLRPVPRAAYEARPPTAGDALVVSDAQATRSGPNADVFAAYDLRSAATTPLRQGGRDLGNLSVLTFGSPRAFVSDELALLRGIADLAALAIANASLHAEVQRRAAELEVRVAERTARLRESLAELERFAYSIAHDLRAPLRAMQGFADALLEEHAERLDAAGPTGREYLRRIADAAARLDALILDLLAYSRLSRAELTLAPVGLAAALRAALARLEARLQERRAKVDVEGQLPAVLAHRETLVQVLAHLLTNAVTFVAPGVEPRVRVWAELGGGNPAAANSLVRLWVADNGIGIAPEHQERIFRVFERLHPVDVYPGTGMGLALVELAMQRLGGRVGVESASGAGSRFWLELPAAPDPAEQVARAE